MPTRLLIAESHPGFRCDLGRFVALLDGEYELVASVESATDALAAVARERPDIAVISLDLRDQRGLALTRTLRRVAPGTAIVVLGDLFDAEYRPAALAAGAAAYVDRLELVRALPDALGALARPAPAANARPVAPAPAPPRRRVAGLAPWQWMHLLITVACFLVASAMPHLRRADTTGQSPTIAFFLAALLGILLLEVRHLRSARPATWFAG